MREENFLRRIKKIHEEYPGNQPFSVYLNSFFRRHPEMGGRDRRETRDYCYRLFRIGKNLPDESFETRLSVASFLCGTPLSHFGIYLLKTYSELSPANIELPVERRVQEVCERYPQFMPENIFSMFSLLSDTIDKDDWYLSFLRQPFVYIRIKKDFREKVIAELKERNIDFRTTDLDNALSFDSETQLKQTVSWDKGFFEIQDIGSQRIETFLKPKDNERWWDACAGSGGKSLLLSELARGVKIFATDERSSILKNFSERMKKSGHSNFTTATADLAGDDIHAEGMFDGIIADVPCSGSGTWQRSPEWLLKNPELQINQHFIPLQRKIVSNLVPFLKPGHPLIYITCSAFSAENEDNARYFTGNLPLKLEKSAYLDGYQTGGDTLFAARFARLF